MLNFSHHRPVQAAADLVHLRGSCAGTTMLHLAGSGRATARRPARASAAQAVPATGSVSCTPDIGDAKIIAFMDFGGDQVAVVHAGLPQLELRLR